LKFNRPNPTRTDTTKELLDKLEKTEARLAQTELDLNSEQNVRRTLQAEVHEAKTREDALAQKQVTLALPG
jgi:wobble nucleotide-excising tRNase